MLLSDFGQSFMRDSSLTATLQTIKDTASDPTEKYTPAVMRMIQNMNRSIDTLIETHVDVKSIEQIHQLLDSARETDEQLARSKAWHQMLLNIDPTKTYYVNINQGLAPGVHHIDIGTHIITIHAAWMGNLTPAQRQRSHDFTQHLEQIVQEKVNTQAAIIRSIYVELNNLYSNLYSSTSGPALLTQPKPSAGWGTRAMPAPRTQHDAEVLDGVPPVPPIPYGVRGGGRGAGRGTRAVIPYVAGRGRGRGIPQVVPAAPPAQPAPIPQVAGRGRGRGIPQVVPAAPLPSLLHIS
jgi:hypothetical protein